jgi:LPS O-antigen subunit length determinant protein (WzzB/FepE family)
MVVREEERVKEPVKPEQPLKALVPMVVTEGGMVKEPVSPEQPTKALEAILVMVGSRVICPEQQAREGV